MGITFSSSDLAAWSKQIGMQGTGGLMKSLEDGVVLSLDTIASNIPRSRSDPRLRSSHVASFSPVYNHVGRA
jgi:hypothetical protein